MLVARRAQQERGGVHGAAGHDDDVRAVGLLAGAAVDNDSLDRAPRRVRLEALHSRVGAQRDVGVLECGAHADHVGVGLAVGRAGEAVESVATHTASGFRVGLVEVHRDRQVKRLVVRPDQVVVELLDTRLVGDGWIRVRARARRLGRVLAGLAVDEVEPLGLGVVGLEIGIGDGPRG